MSIKINVHFMLLELATYPYLCKTEHYYATSNSHLLYSSFYIPVLLKPQSYTSNHISESSFINCRTTEGAWLFNVLWHAALLIIKFDLLISWRRSWQSGWCCTRRLFEFSHFWSKRRRAAWIFQTSTWLNQKRQISRMFHVS